MVRWLFFREIEAKGCRKIIKSKGSIQTTETIESIGIVLLTNGKLLLKTSTTKRVIFVSPLRAWGSQSESQSVGQSAQPNLVQFKSYKIYSDQ